MHCASTMLPCSEIWLRKTDFGKPKCLGFQLGFIGIIFLKTASNLFNFYHLKNIKTT